MSSWFESIEYTHTYKAIITGLPQYIAGAIDTLNLSKDKVELM